VFELEKIAISWHPVINMYAASCNCQRNEKVKQKTFDLLFFIFVRVCNNICMRSAYIFIFFFLIILHWFDCCGCIKMTKT
jgi:hypothetical protein